MSSRKLLVSSSCTVNCSDMSPENEHHQGEHTQVERKQIVQLIEEEMYHVMGTDWSNLIKSIAKIFDEVKKEVKGLENKIFDDLKKEKMRHLLNTNDYELINMALQIADTAKDKIEARCCDIYNIHRLLSASNKVVQYEAVKHIEQETIETIEKGILKLSNLTSTLNNPEGGEQLNQMNFFKQVARPKQLRTITIDMVPSELPTSRFNITLKIIKIIKRFTLNEVHKVVFVGGDQTGVAECVMTDHPLIKEKQTIFTTNCKTYVFKNTKQIQSCHNSVLQKKNDKKKFVNIGYNISIKMEDKKAYKIKRKAIGYDYRGKANSQKEKSQDELPSQKIQTVSPGDKQINIIAEVLLSELQVMEIEDTYGNSLKCLIGDDTALIHIILPFHFSFQLGKGNTYQIINVNVGIEEGKLVVIASKDTKVRKCEDNRFRVLNHKKNLSKDYWVETGLKKIQTKIEEIEEVEEVEQGEEVQEEEVEEVEKVEENSEEYSHDSLS